MQWKFPKSSDQASKWFWLEAHFFEAHLEYFVLNSTGLWFWGITNLSRRLPNSVPWDLWSEHGVAITSGANVIEAYNLQSILAYYFHWTESQEKLESPTIFMHAIAHYIENGLAKSDHTLMDFIIFSYREATHIDSYIEFLIIEHGLSPCSLFKEKDNALSQD